MGSIVDALGRINARNVMLDFGTLTENSQHHLSCSEECAYRYGAQ